MLSVSDPVRSFVILSESAQESGELVGLGGPILAPSSQHFLLVGLVKKKINILM